MIFSLTKKDLTNNDFDFFPLRVAFTGNPTGLLDLPTEIQVSIYEFVFGLYDLELRNVHKIRSKVLSPGDLSPSFKRPSGRFKLIYQDKRTRNGILLACKAITPIAVEARQKGYSGTLRVEFGPEHDLHFFFDYCRSLEISNCSNLLPETRTLSVPNHCSKKEILQATKLLPGLQAVEIRHTIVRNPNGLKTLARHMGMRAGETLFKQKFEDRLRTCVQTGELDKYCERLTASLIPSLQDVQQMLVLNGFGYVDTFMDTTFQFRQTRNAPSICVVKIDRITAEGITPLRRYVTVPAEKDYKRIQHWLENISLTDSEQAGTAQLNETTWLRVQG